MGKKGLLGSETEVVRKERYSPEGVRNNESETLTLSTFPDTESGSEDAFTTRFRKVSISVDQDIRRHTSGS